MPRIRKQQRCKHESGCTTRPSFGLPGGTWTRCSKHKTNDMVDLVHAKCGHPSGCTTHPSFGPPGAKKATRCRKHAEDDMVNLASRKCDHPSGCTTQPYFGPPGAKKATRCKKHKTDDMINMRSKKCDHPNGCTTQPVFGPPDAKRPTRCKRHKTDEMIDLKNVKCDHPNGCATRAYFGFEGSQPTRCMEHMEPGMEDVANARCSGPDEVTPCPVRDRAYVEGMCYACAVAAGKRRARKLTEDRCLATVVRSLGKTFEKFTPCFTPQLRVGFECSDAEGTCAYVDAVVEFPEIRIMLEIDELAHCTRGYSCDERRMESVGEALLLQSSDARPIAWVRFNPDEPDGATRSTPAEQIARCELAVAAIERLREEPRSCVEYVNYPAE